LEALVALALMDELKAESEYKGILQSSQNADERTHAEKILKIMQHIELTFGPGDVLGYLKKKVEYTDPFIH